MAKILLVDDDYSISRRLSSFIESFGYTLISTIYPEKVFQILVDEPIDLILLDVYTPKLDGLSLLKELKSHPVYSALPVIMLSEDTDERLLKNCLDSGAVDFINKPLKEVVLQARIHAALSTQDYIKKLEEVGKQRQEAQIKLAEAYDKIYQDLEKARITQQALFPSQDSKIPGLQVAVKYRSMEQLGGDFYDVIPLDKKRTGILIGDVTGHGTSAALLSFMVIGLIRNLGRQKYSPAVILKKINEVLCAHMPFGKYITMFYCIYDAASKKLTYANAGHPPAFIFRCKSSHIISLESSGPLIGLVNDGLDELKDTTIKLSAKDKVILYTDGIVECMNDKDQLYGSKRFKQKLRNSITKSLGKLLDDVYSHAVKFKGDVPFKDDIALVALRVKSKI